SCRGSAQVSMISAYSRSGSSTSISSAVSARSAGVGLGSTCKVAMADPFPALPVCKREPEARRLRSARGARQGPQRAVRRRPGPAAVGYVLETADGTVLAAEGGAIGVATNNVAEYRALVEGLKKAAQLQVDEVDVISDSELLVRQMSGEYKVKNRALRELYEEAT